jgi:hypothetical protein
MEIDRHPNNFGHVNTNKKVNYTKNARKKYLHPLLCSCTLADKRLLDLLIIDY